MKVGKKVKVVATGETGKVKEVFKGARGDWLKVDLSANPKKPQIKSFRPSAVQPA